MKMMLIAVAVLATATAQAKSNTEYFNRAEAGKSKLELSYSMANSKPATDATPSVETEIKQNDLAFDYSYGLSDMMSVGVKNVLSGETKSKEGNSPESKETGMDDFNLYLKGQSDMIHWGADLTLGLGKKKDDKRGSGGLGVGGYVGMLTSSDAWNYGGKLALNMPLERTTEGNSQDTKTTGGMATKLAGVAEYNYGMGMFTGELAYNMKGEQTSKTGSTESKTKAYNYMSLALGATYDFNEMAKGLLSYEMWMFGARDLNDTTKLKSYNASIITVGAEFTF